MSSTGSINVIPFKARSYGAMALWKGQDCIFGGKAGNALLNDFWCYMLPTSTWTHLVTAGTVPAARYGHCMLSIPGVLLVVVGGITTNGIVQVGNPPLV